jgi:hypothetical protein
MRMCVVSGSCLPQWVTSRAMEALSWVIPWTRKLEGLGLEIQGDPEEPSTSQNFWQVPDLRRRSGK